jgi:hypothetical protein
MPTNRLFRAVLLVFLAWVLLVLTRGALAQDQLMKVKGGHQLGETAAQFFAEGY